MNEKTIIDCLNTAKQDATIKIYIHSRPYSYIKSNINYWSDGANLFILDRKHFLRHTINLNSIKNIAIENKVELYKLSHMELQDYIRNNMKMSI